MKSEEHYIITHVLFRTTFTEKPLSLLQLHDISCFPHLWPVWSWTISGESPQGSFYLPVWSVLALHGRADERVSAWIGLWGIWRRMKEEWQVDIYVNCFFGAVVISKKKFSSRHPKIWLLFVFLIIAVNNNNFKNIIRLRI